jgi:hypothetical protein
MPMIDLRCQSGRLANYGGRWTEPCPRMADEALAFSEDVRLPRVDDTPVLMFCTNHMTELIAGGMVDEPYVGVEEWIARVEGPELSGATLARMIDDIEHRGDR